MWFGCYLIGKSFRVAVQSTIAAISLVFGASETYHTEAEVLAVLVVIIFIHEVT